MGAAASNAVEPLKLLPVSYVFALIGGIFSIHRCYHIRRLRERFPRHDYVEYESTAVIAVTAMILVCLFRSMMTSPGTVPDTEAFQINYAYDAGRSTQSGKQKFKEHKKSGDRRSCKWCQKYKPDRCHHCRVCRTCILKMDHHCPWLYNCIGANNHKYFYLLLLYSTIALQLIGWTMLPTVSAALHPGVNFMTMLACLFGESLCLLFGTLCTFFFGFHTWLMARAMTTIEFCEKGRARSQWDRGLLLNTKAVLGENPWLWFLPVSPPIDDSVRVMSEETPLMWDVEAAAAKLKAQEPIPGVSTVCEAPLEASPQADAERTEASSMGGHARWEEESSVSSSSRTSATPQRHGQASTPSLREDEQSQDDSAVITASSTEEGAAPASPPSRQETTEEGCSVAPSTEEQGNT